MGKTNNKNKYIDDGHTIYNMDVDGMPHRKIKSDDSVSVTKKEKKAIIKAAFHFYIPILIGIIICFFIAMLLIKIWLS